MAGTPLATAFVRLRLDTSGTKAEATAGLKKSLAGVSGTVGLGLSDEDAKKKLDAFKARLASLHGAAADITVKDKDATARLAAIAARLARLDEKVANPKVTLEGFARTEAELAAVDAGLDRVNRKTAESGVAARGAASGFATLAAAGITLGPAMLPVLAAATAGALGMGAALAGAGSALGLFAAAAAGNLTELKKQMTKVEAANKSANLAEQTAAGKRTAAQKQAIVNAKALTAAFQKEFGAEADAIEKLKSSWLSFTTQPVVTNAIAAGARVLTAALPHLTPLLRLGADAAQAFTGALAGFTQSGGLDRLVAGLVKIGKISLGGFLAVLHNLAVAIGALSGGAGNFATGVINGMVKLSAAFASWATNKGPGALSALMGTVRKLGPGVLALLQNLAAAVPALARGLFPLAPLSLALSTALAGIIAHANPHVITALAVAFLGLYAAVKLSAGITAIMETKAKLLLIAEKAQWLWGKLVAGATKAWAAAQWLLNAALDANPIGLAIIAIAGLTAGIILAYKHSETFRKIVKEAFHVALVVIRDVWSWIKGNWPLLLTILTGPIGLAVTFIVRHWAAIQSGISAVLGWIRRNWRLLLGILTGPVGAAVAIIKGHWTTIENGAKTVWNWIRNSWDRIRGWLIAPFRAAKKIIGGIFDTIKGWIDAITGFFSGQGGGPLPGGHGGGVPPKGSGPAAAQAYARSIMGAYGMSAGTQFPALQQLWNNESGWRWNADNPTSPAYGIPQADPGSKMAAAGADWMTNYKTQIRWGLGYIRSVYRQPTTALAMWNSRSPHWYAKGGMITEPVRGIGLRTGRGYMLGEHGPERVTPGAGTSGDAERMERLIAVVQQSPYMIANLLADALNSVGRRSAHAAAWSGGSW